MKPDKEFIIREAIENHGLIGSEVESTLQSLLNESKIYIKDGDSFYVSNESHKRIDGKSENTGKAPKIAEKMDCDCLTVRMEDFGYASRNNIGNTAEMKNLKLYEVICQLIKSLTELNRVLHEERIKSQALLEENFNLKLNISKTSVVYSNDQISANKKTHEHNDANQSFAIPNEKAIDSTLSNAKQKNKRRRSRFNIYKSSNNDKGNLHKGIHMVEPAPEPLLQKSSIVKDSIVAHKEAKSGTRSSRKQPSKKENIDSVNQGAWPTNTVLIIGDSMLSNIDEKKLSHRYHTKVRAFRGSSIEDLHDYIKPLLKKQPEKIILLIGTNDLQVKSVADIIKGLKSLLDMIYYSIPNCKVVVSEIIRREDIKTLNGNVGEFNRALKTMNVDILRQQNTTAQHLGRKGLHLNFEGNKQLAKNIITKLRSPSF